MEEVLKFLQANPVFYAATIDKDKPKVRPLGFSMQHENRLYFTVGKHKESYRQLRANPNIEISTTNAKKQWVRISGKVVFDDRPETALKVLETMPSLKNIYNEQTGFVLAPFYLVDATAEFADMDGGFKKIDL